MPFSVRFLCFLSVVIWPPVVSAQFTTEQMHPSATVHQLAGVESTEIIPPWKWHTKGVAHTIFLSGREQTLLQSRYSVALGFGIPGNTEINLSMPLGYTFHAYQREGGGAGDLRVGVLHQIKGAKNGGIGLLAGVFGYVPTGQRKFALGEGDFAMQPFVSASVTSFSTSLTANIGYLFRSEHFIRLKNGELLEQDNNVVWRIALRIPKDEDIAWSLIASGLIGIATADGLWPAANQRPLWIGGAIDFPAFRDRRIGLFCTFLTGEYNRGIQLGVQFSGIARDRDEDRDGILLNRDQCPFLREDPDGFQDDDGCPDLDNDMDSFPDSEDACPLKKADDFSMDGC